MLENKFETNHPAERGPKFAKASGALQVLFYKTEIEAMLRTPAMAGFHLNGLMDYPGEGIALIGMLDAMGDSKGLATPEEFRRFCSETVALTAIKEQNLASGSLFEADALVRHHGPEDIDDGQWLWSIADASGKVLLKGDLGTQSVPTGGLTVLGKIEAKLPDVTEARELTLALWMAGSEVKNDWQFWVYPAKLDLAIPEGVVVADLWGPQVKEMLQAGGRVLLMPDKSSVVEPVDIWFWNIFWGRGLFPSIPRPMGIYCDPAQPALAQFPTRDHSQFQWYSLLTDSYAITMNELPFDFEPVVFMIDDFNLSHRLGMVLEAKVGKGRLLINTLNLGQKGERTLAQQQMLNSLLAHVGARDFAPTQTLTPEQLDKLVHDTQSAAWLERSPKATIIEVSSSNPGMEKEQMQDGNTATFWHTRFAGGFAKPPHYVVLKVPGGIPVTGLSYFAYQAGNGNGHVKAYSVYVSNDGKNWGVPLMKGALQTNLAVEQQIRFPAPTTRNFIKFEVTDAVSFGGQPIAAVGELDVILK